MSYKAWFSRFLSAAPERLHFAAHSHHYWPDAARDGQLRAFDDAVRLVDDKWGVVFGEVLPAARRHVARILNLSRPERIAFAPSTHDLVLRVISCLAHGRPLRVLTTDGEYHSFRRQMRRLEEAGLAVGEYVAVEPFETFPARFAAAAGRGGHDLVYFSQVFFNSGYAIADLGALVAAVPDPRTYVVIDGYHGFCALPTDLAPIEERAFYVSGGYKYAMAGEGACFLHCPPGYGERPVNTGWMASFGTIASRQDDHVPYGPEGTRFFGATFDPTAVYRLVAVHDFLHRQGVTIERIHDHVRALQARFLDGLDAVGHSELRTGTLLPPRACAERGHFLTFRTPAAEAIEAALARLEVKTDHRADRLRFGFALYHDEADVDELLARLRASRG